MHADAFRAGLGRTHANFLRAVLGLALGLLALAQVGCGSVTSAGRRHYAEVDLVSDLPGRAATFDANLVNPWGLVFGPAGELRVANNGTAVSTSYSAAGQVNGPVVTILPPSSSPTGVALNQTTGFPVGTGAAARPARLLFATEEGTISAWNPGVNPSEALVVADRSSAGTVYKGLAIGTGDAGSFLFATNFRIGVVDVFDSGFTFLRSFTDTSLPVGFAPFGITQIGGRLGVTFAKQDNDRHDDVPGPGNGFVDVFDLNGNVVQRFASGGVLNSPWGVALAGAGFGRFSGALLVGNFGDGRIHAFDAGTGALLGTLESAEGQPIVVDGLWTLAFGTGPAGAGANTLFFTAGINNETHGLLGTLGPAP